MEENSILKTVKVHLGLPLESSDFDSVLLIYINSAFMILNQIGIGPSSPFILRDDSTEWSDFSESVELIGMVKHYISIKTQIAFDPPTTSFILDAVKESIVEMEERLKIQQEFIIPNIPPIT